MTHLTLWLAQTQFFSSMGFMLLFLALELGLAWTLLYFRIRAMGAQGGPWMAAYRFWARVFALAFALGFAASFPVLIQLGSLWPGLLARIGDVAGPMLAAGILSVFVFKSCFMGAMLFGLRRLPKLAHTAVVAMVAVGTSLSTFCLLSLVSWTHTPTGAIPVDGIYRVIDIGQVVFNPAMPWYAALFVTAAMLAVAFLMLGVVAGQAARNPTGEAYRPVFRTALVMAVVGVVLHTAALTGSLRLAAQHQPARAAAVAAFWDSGPRADLLVLGWPDAARAANRHGWIWPDKARFLLAADSAGQWRGLDQFSGMAPPVGLTFWSFRLVLVIAVLMLVTALTSWGLTRRKGGDPAALPAGWQAVLRVMGFSGGVLVLAGLLYVQAGVFPYAVYGTITLTEVLAEVTTLALLSGTALQLACYGLLLAGFMYLLRYVSRYGVIPVSRRRGRA